MANKKEPFNIDLARSCARAFSVSTGLGCTVCGKDNYIYYETGFSCAKCPLCKTVGFDSNECFLSNKAGMNEAERFGGKYVYYCKMGFCCFVSPIVGQAGSVANITAGPFIMVEKDDYLQYDATELLHISKDKLSSLEEKIKDLPYVAPARVQELSNLLFMSVGFLSDVFEANNMLEKQNSDVLQGHVSAYIMQLKSECVETEDYPFKLENDLITNVTKGNKKEALSMLNELLGYIFFYSGGDLQHIKARTYELIVLISRASIVNGADPKEALERNENSLTDLPKINSIDELSFWLKDIVKNLSNNVFWNKGFQHDNVIHAAIQYMNNNYSTEITLEKLASRCKLSPSYFSRIFKKETGLSYSKYLTQIRIEKSKSLLLYSNDSIVDIAFAVGYDEHSYFTRVFKNNIGMSPMQFRKKHYLHKIENDKNV